MRLILLADTVVGERVLTYLLADYLSDLSLVVTTHENNIFEIAKSAGVPVIVFQDTDTLVRALNADKSELDLGILAWWPTIIGTSLIEFPEHGFINFHPSLLPFNRGKHYNFWAIVENAPFGVTLHFVNEGVDTGDVIAQREIPYDWTDNGETLYNKATKEIIKLFCDSYSMLRSLNIPRQPQDLNQGSFHRAIELDAASRIDLQNSYTGRDFLNLLRARTFTGHPACWFDDHGERYEVRVSITRSDS